MAARIETTPACDTVSEVQIDPRSVDLGSLRIERIVSFNTVATFGWGTAFTFTYPDDFQPLPAAH